MASATLTFSPITAVVSASSFSVSHRRISVRSLGFRGLNIEPRSASITQSSRSMSRDPRRLGRGGRFVCQAQDTAVDGLFRRFNLIF